VCVGMCVLMLTIVLAKRQVVLPNHLWNQRCYLYITHAYHCTC